MDDMTILNENEWPCNVKDSTAKHSNLLFLFKDLEAKKKQVFASYFVDSLATKMKEIERLASKY